MSADDRAQLVNLHLKLLKLELKAEKQRVEESRNAGASTLTVRVEKEDDANGIYELTVSREALDHGIEKGSVVSISNEPPILPEPESETKKATKPKLPSAVVMEVTLDSSTTKLTLKLGLRSKPQDWEDTNMLIKPFYVKQAEDMISDQLSDAMRWLRGVDTTRAHDREEHSIRVVREMFKENQRARESSAMDGSHETRTSHALFNPKLDESQGKAVKMALRDWPLTVIHGPPGTGKTTTIVEVILQHLKLGKRVLVCAPSNKAVDNLLESLWKQTVKTPHCSLKMSEVLRIGHPARVDEKHRRFSPEVQVERLFRLAKLMEDRRISKMAADQMTAELFARALVVMSTLTSANSQAQHYRTFDLLVIDECGQATEPACWLAIPLAKKVLLAGDHYQLPPTIISQEAARRGLAVSLIERQVELHGEDVVHMLDTQYRMHELIQQWSSRLLYDGKLKAAPEVASHMLSDLPGVRSTARSAPTLLLLDTAGCRLKESQGKTKSYQNMGEARLIVEHAKLLVAAGLKAEHIGVITPYKGQVSLISGMMCAAKLAEVEVKSVDGFQGGQKEAILLSLVRSNAHRKVGFVGDRRRLNVAVTRARRHLFVVCDTATVCRDPDIRSLVLHLEKSGTKLSAYKSRGPRPRRDENSPGDGGDNHSAARPARGGAKDDITQLTNSLGAMKLGNHGAASRKMSTASSTRHAPVVHGGRSFTKPRPAHTAGVNTARVHWSNSQRRQSPAKRPFKSVKPPTSHHRTRLSSGSNDFSDVYYDDFW